MASSRLDRLVTLLDKGSTQTIRNIAAQQLADIQKQHPDELFNLLGRVLPYLRAQQWDTRTAAAKAIGGIVFHVDKFDPNADDGGDQSNGKRNGNEKAIKEENGNDGTNGLLQLDSLDISMVLQHGKKLLGSPGKEYDYSLAGLDAAQRLAHQKQSLTARLGLGGEYIEDDLISANDVSSAKAKPHTSSLPKVDTSVGRQASLSSPFPTKSPQDSSEAGLSKRLMNRQKRKAKSQAKMDANKMRVVDLSGRRQSEIGSTPDSATPFPVRLQSSDQGEDERKPDYFSIKRETEEDDDSKVVSEFKGDLAPEKSAIQTEAEEMGMEWPFERMCEFMMVELFDPHWETRHGAAMGIREVIRVHGAGSGRVFGKSRHENDELNRRFLDDLACRLLCVLMLDRFGDFVSDTVVAPIRETIGQTLGALLSQLSDETALSVYALLNRMIMQKDLDLKNPIWEVCHGGMIGLKYLVAIRRDLLLSHGELIDGVMDCVMRGLAHHDDDVRSVSAATLLPIAQEMVQLRSGSLSRLCEVVWNCLTDLQDDLSASTGAVMDLLAKLCTFPEALQAMKANAALDNNSSFATLVPRLYPFLRHTLTLVRSAVLRAMLTFLSLEGPGVLDWVNGLPLRLIFQNLLVERDQGVLQLSLELWTGLLQNFHKTGFAQSSQEVLLHLPAVIELTMQPIGMARDSLPMDLSLFIKPSGVPLGPPPTNSSRHHAHKVSVGGRRRKSDKEEEPAASTHNVDGHMLQGEVELVGADALVRSRIHAAKALGLLFYLWEVNKLPPHWATVLPYLKSKFSSTQLTASLVIEEYASHFTEPSHSFAILAEQVLAVLEDDRPLWYSDIVSTLQAAQGQCFVLLDVFRTHAHVPPSKLPTITPVCQGGTEAGPTAFSLSDAEKIVDGVFDRLMKALNPVERVKNTQALNDARVTARSAVVDAKAAFEVRQMRIRAGAASALVALKQVPKKPGAVIKSIMDSVKMEENSELQMRSSTSVAALIDHYNKTGKRAALEKILGNLVKFCCVDASESPEFHPNATLEEAILSLRKEEDRKDHADAAKFDKDSKDAKIMRRGCKQALEVLVRMYGADLFSQLPKLQALIRDPLVEGLSNDLPADIMDPDNQTGQDILDGMSTLRAIAPTLDPGLHPWVVDILPIVAKALQSKLSVIRYAAAKCFATICSVIPIDGMTMLVERVLPAISSALDVHQRQGAVECIYHLMHVMEETILPYVIFLIVPILGRMSDSNDDVRLLATTSFATLVKLVPLEAGIPDPPGLSEELLKGRDRERKFMAQMLDPKKVEAFTIPVAIKAELRSYQQDGVNWLAFLNRYHLHGILCDDMGLGKTLQTLCIVASDHHMRAEEYKKTDNPDSRPLPSLIICPPTLSGHWQQEIKQFAPFLSSVAYVGPPSERSQKRGLLAKADIVITSYDICRNDLEVFAPINWNYCVLDEGHLIKNPKAKSTMAVKKLKSNHRLILSGTPIQNNVLELWSLFDYLMPGFLGTEKVFLDRFAKPIAASRHAKSSSKEQEAGALAIEALHKQVLPFLLRRLKEEVLNDLPPKILQNYYCDLSDLQKRLFDDFFKKERKAVESKVGSVDKEAKQHIFQALQYMRKLCNSPSLVVKEGSKQYDSIQKQLASSNSNIHDIVHAPKLNALKDLLIDCGIGVGEDNNGLPGASYVSQHRALIFCQMKEMLDTVQNEVLRKLLPSVQFLRLDGSVEASKRQNIVNQFNTDPSYDCLLLTTSVGGLGLNLTGADTVIFVEHDWNPQKDIQAMDRAHRIGQKKVVNVYRLITRGTLEEKILNLQRFKIDVASTVVNQQNAGLGTMETDQILDLFNLGETAEGADKMTKDGAGGVGNEEDMVDIEGNVREKGKKGWLDGLGELSDERQYQEEFDLDNFVAGLQR